MYSPSLTIPTVTAWPFAQPSTSSLCSGSLDTHSPVLLHVLERRVVSMAVENATQVVMTSTCLLLAAGGHQCTSASCCLPSSEPFISFCITKGQTQTDRQPPLEQSIKFALSQSQSKYIRIQENRLARWCFRGN